MIMIKLSLLYDSMVLNHIEISQKKKESLQTDPFANKPLKTSTNSRPSRVLWQGTI